MVKELIENSLDAKASRISLEVDATSGGLDYLSITDDGRGISKLGCMELGLVNNLTSKINTFENLLGKEFDTFGYRGRSLYLLSSLTCKDTGYMKIITKTSTELFGRSLTIVNGSNAGETSQEVFSTKSGTTVQFRNLLKNTFPVRYRYLSQGSGHYLHEIKMLVTKFAMIFNQIRFCVKVMKNQKKIKELIIPSHLSITGILAIQFPAFASPREQFLSTHKSIHLDGDVIQLSITIQKYHSNSLSFKLLSINDRIMEYNAKNSIFHKTNSEIKNVYKILNFKIIPKNWVIIIDGISNKYIDHSCESSKTNISFFNATFESKLLLDLSNLVFQLISPLQLPSIDSTKHNLPKPSANQFVDDMLTVDKRRVDIIQPKVSELDKSVSFINSSNIKGEVNVIQTIPSNEEMDTESYPTIPPISSDSTNVDITLKTNTSSLFSSSEHTNVGWSFSMNDIEEDVGNSNKGQHNGDFFEPLNTPIHGEYNNLEKPSDSKKSSTPRIKRNKNIQRAPQKASTVREKHEKSHNKYPPNYEFSFTPNEKSHKHQIQVKLDSFFEKNNHFANTSKRIHQEQKTLQISLVDVASYHDVDCTILNRWLTRTGFPNRQLLISLKEYYIQKSSKYDSNPYAIVERTSDGWFQVSFDDRS